MTSLPGMPPPYALGPGIGWEMPAAVFGALLAASIIIYILLRILTHRHEGHGPDREGRRAKGPPKGL